MGTADNELTFFKFVFRCLVQIELILDLKMSHLVETF